MWRNFAKSGHPAYSCGIKPEMEKWTSTTNGFILRQSNSSANCKIELRAKMCPFFVRLKAQTTHLQFYGNEIFWFGYFLSFFTLIIYQLISIKKMCRSSLEKILPTQKATTFQHKQVRLKMLLSGLRKSQKFNTEYVIMETCFNCGLSRTDKPPNRDITVNLDLFCQWETDLAKFRHYGKILNPLFQLLGKFSFLSVAKF